MITVNVRGSREVERILSEIAPKESERLVRQTVSAIGSDVVREARKGMKFTGKYSTGRMRKLTKKRQRRTRRGIIQTDVLVGKRAFYWRFYEYGQGKIRKRGMFANAIGKVRGNLGARFEALFLKKLEKRLARLRRKK